MSVVIFSQSCCTPVVLLVSLCFMNLHRQFVLPFCVSSYSFIRFCSFLSLPFFVRLFHFYFFMPSCLPLFSVVCLFLFMSLSLFPFFFFVCLFVYFCISSFPSYCFAFLLCFLLCPLPFLPASLYAVFIVAGCRAGGAPA